MNRRSSLILLSALVIAGAASFLVYRLQGGVRAAPKPAVQLVVAARDLATGTLIREGDLRTAPWQGAAPKGATLDRARVINRGVLSSIYEGEPVTEARLAQAGSGGGLAATIPAGMRACAVRVNEVVGVGGFVVPGMRVDVLITGVPPGEAASAGTAVKTLLQNIEVLSAGTNIEQDKEGKPLQVPVVNLLVDPHQAEILSLAGNEAKIQLVLRNPMDREVSTPPGTSVAELFGASRAKPPGAAAHPAPAPPASPAARPVTSVDTIEVLNGSVRAIATFPRTAGQGELP